MTQTIQTYQKGLNPKVDRLIDLAAAHGLERDVLATTNQALYNGSTYSHIFPESVEKVLYRHSARMQTEPDFAKTLLLAGFVLPYKHGVQFRGMMSALTANQPLQALEAFDTNPFTRANVILAYRNLAMPRLGEGYLLEENVHDCSLAISHPVLRLKASGYYIDQLAKMLNTPVVQELREQYQPEVLVDVALIEFAKRFVYAEIDAHREIEANNPKRLTHKLVNDHITTTFAHAAPDIAFSATLPYARDAHREIFASATQNSLHLPHYYHQAVRSFIEKHKPSDNVPAQDAKQVLKASKLEALAVA